MKKDELAGNIMAESFALEAKMYVYRKLHKRFVDKCCKGTKKFAVTENLTFDDYSSCLFDSKTIYREQMLFENKKHQLHSESKHKIDLNRDNNKRGLQADSTLTLARLYLA